MFIDETGTSTERDKPFSVTGIIFDNRFLINQLGPSIEAFKSSCFGRKDIPLHLTKIVNVKEPYRVADGVSPEHLKKFWDDLPQFLASLDFQIISVTVDKPKLENYFATHKDAYEVAFAHIMKSFYSFLSSPDVVTAKIVLEARDDYNNFLIQKAFFDIFNHGTVHLNFENYKDKLKGFIFSDKVNPQYKYGLEIADILCNPLNRVRLGLIEAKPKHINYGHDNKIFRAIKDKIYVKDQDHDFRNWGFKKVPITKKVRLWVDNPQPQGIISQVIE